MTPTPEDIALAEEMDEYMSIDLDLAARLIAAHTAPLRELAEIGRLAVEHQRAFRAGDWGAFVSTTATVSAACCAYLAKQEESK